MYKFPNSNTKNSTLQCITHTVQRNNIKTMAQTPSDEQVPTIFFSDVQRKFTEAGKYMQ